MKNIRNLALILLALAPLPLAAQVDELGTKALGIVEAHATSVVTLSVVMKYDFSGRSEEQRYPMPGLVVSKAGLIMIPGAYFSPPQDGFKVTPEDIKVTFGKQEKEYEAFLVGKDSKLGLAFVQVVEELPADLDAQVVDFSGKEKPLVGEQLITVGRMPKEFDYTPIFSLGRILAYTKKPRKAFLVDRGAAPGQAAYNLAGQVVGFHSQLQAESGERRGGQAIILPNNVARGAIGTALKQADKMRAERAERAKEAGSKEEAKEAAEVEAAEEVPAAEEGQPEK